MRMVTKTVRIRGARGVRAVEALFDTGASKSLIRRDVDRRVGRLLRSPTAWTFQLGDGKGRLTTNEMVGLFFQLKGVPIAHTFIVARHDEGVRDRHALQLEEETDHLVRGESPLSVAQLKRPRGRRSQQPSDSAVDVAADQRLRGAGIEEGLDGADSPGAANANRLRDHPHPGRG